MPWQRACRGRVENEISVDIIFYPVLISISIGAGELNGRRKNTRY
jgi:hypothetical protein